jgi:exosortase A-associated hydrolase 1
MNEQPIAFDCGGSVLVGILHMPSTQRQRIGVLVVVGGPQYRVGSHRQFTLMARELAAAGYPTLRFDYRGMGDSPGNARTFEAVHDDIRAAIDQLTRAVPGLESVVLWGLCDAASAVLMYCGSDPRVAGLVLANPWVRTTSGEARAFLRHYYWQRLMQREFWSKVARLEFDLIGSVRDWLSKLRAAGSSGGGQKHAAVQLGFIDRMYEGLAGFRGRILLLISGKDLTAQEFVELCGVDQRWQRQLARGSVEQVALRDADHTFSNREALTRAIRHTIDWLRAGSGTSAART